VDRQEENESVSFEFVIEGSVSEEKSQVEPSNWLIPGLTHNLVYVGD
jgi:hypothetical protein